MRRITVHRVDRSGQLLVGQREEPAHAGGRPLRQVQPQGKDQHHVAEVLSDERPAGLRLAQLLHHHLDRPAQHGPV